MFEIAPISQNDPQWADELIGTSSQTIGRWGCLLTCMTMVANHYGSKLTPSSLNTLMVESGLFTGSDIIPAKVPLVVPEIVFKKFVRYYPYAKMDEIITTLKSNKPVIAMVDRSTAEGMQSHWVVLLAVIGSDLLMQDPYPFPSETGQLLRQHYGWNGSCAETIRAAVWIDRAIVSGGNDVQKD